VRMKHPYRLPVPLTCDPADVVNGVSMNMIDKYIEKHKKNLRRYEYLERLYSGFFDIDDEPPKEAWKPDNRLTVPFPKYITDTFTGYGYGIPIKEEHPDDAINERIHDFQNDNELTDHEAELIKRCCIYGHAWEYIYQDENTRTKMTVLTPKDIFVVYDDTLLSRALFAVRYGYHSDNSRKPRQQYGEILTRDEIIEFDGEKIINRKQNPYGLIPCVEWRLNDERSGLYEQVSRLIEQYNHVISEKANDVDAFAEAYLAIIGAEVDENDIYRIRDDRIINLYGTDNAKDVLVQFLTKPTADATQENLLDRLEKEIYETSMVANISDETFGNATSGIALAYKLQAMSNLARMFDRKIEKSIWKRYKIFCSLKTNVSDPEAYKDISITMTRNLPKNIQEEAQTAAQLEGVVSKETQLRVLSIVDDPRDEIQKMQDEEDASQTAAVTNALYGSTHSDGEN
jgi:SPP1 family phage portal protein